MNEKPATASARVDFYLIDSPDRRHILRFACRLTAKVFALRQRIWLRTSNAEEAALLDELLWTFSDESFIPHRCIKAGASVNGAASAGDANEVLIGAFDARSPPNAPSAFAVLINLAPTLPAMPSVGARIAEIVGADVDQRANARERFKHYRRHGMDLQSHFIK